MVSGGGTNLQAILDAIDSGKITNAKVEVVISNNPGAYALERARDHGIEAVCISPKSFESRAAFNEAFLKKTDEYNLDLIVLAGFLVTIPEEMIRKYRNKIINIHPSLIPSFCGVGYYGLKVHEAALARGVKVTGATVHYICLLYTSIFIFVWMERFQLSHRVTLIVVILPELQFKEL